MLFLDFIRPFYPYFGKKLYENRANLFFIFPLPIINLLYVKVLKSLITFWEIADDQILNLIINISIIVKQGNSLGGLFISEASEEILVK